MEVLYRACIYQQGIYIFTERMVIEVMNSGTQLCSTLYKKKGLQGAMAHSAAIARNTEPLLFSISALRPNFIEVLKH